MILRLWNGRTTPQGAAAYDRLLDQTVAPGIVERRLAGLHRFEVWRREEQESGDGADFLTAMWFEDAEAVARFTGGDPRRSVVPPEARELLASYDARSRHYSLRRRHL